MGCVLIRHGGKHDWYQNPETKVSQPVPRHGEIADSLAKWVLEVKPGAPTFFEYTIPEEGVGAGLTEAARGALGHWLRVEQGRIAHYQIIAPTSWNFSPRDAAGRPGALEAALVGAPVSAGALGVGHSVAVQHIVRSFDPCMVCTVH